MKLTPMQDKIYQHIRACIREQGYPPSVREIGAAMGLKSPSTVHFHLKRMEEAGVLTISSGKGRAIALRDVSDAPDVPDAPDACGARSVPIVGTVAAGSPILAQERIEGYLTLDAVGRGGTYFALRVRGESMLNAGILPGEYVIVRQQPEANPGEIVVALIGDEATVKRYSVRDGAVWLLPENDAYSPIDGANAQILGIVTAVMRLYERT